MNNRPTENELKRLFPNISKDVLRRSLTGASALRSRDEKRIERNALGGGVQGKAKSGDRFKIVFTVYAVHPADWDNYDIKALQDLVVKSGIIPADHWFALKGEIDPKKVQRPEEEKTIISIIRL